MSALQLNGTSLTRSEVLVAREAAFRVVRYLAQRRYFDPLVPCATRESPYVEIEHRVAEWYPIPSSRASGDGQMKIGWYWNQWLVGLMYDEGRILATRWLVILVGPLTVSISLGRGERHRLRR